MPGEVLHIGQSLCLALLIQRVLLLGGQDALGLALGRCLIKHLLAKGDLPLKGCLFFLVLGIALLIVPLASVELHLLLALGVSQAQVVDGLELLGLYLGSRLLWLLGSTAAAAGLCHCGSCGNLLEGSYLSIDLVKLCLR